MSVELALTVFRQMHRTRALEERSIKMSKSGEAYFWIGGPGEEAFSVPLGLLTHKGEGLDYDYLHLHYRCSGTILALGGKPIDSLRQMRNTATDPYSGGRNFAGHPAIKEWNVVPVSSPIEVQYSMAPGTALAQKRHGGRGITIVTGGDAGTAEGDFPTCLVWSSRPGWELPVLIIVTNNEWGISTSAQTQHGEKHIADRGIPFGIRTKTINGNDPETSYRELKAAMDYVRTERKPFLLEARVSRLYGHSSSSGANFITEEVDPLKEIETKLEQRSILTRAHMDQLREKYTQELLEASKQVRTEPQPEGSTIWNHVFADSNGAKRGH
jgi:2-oxoisovalerate dehydrogenase E1 component alpha subunit